jgi:hypothetical protein
MINSFLKGNKIKKLSCKKKIGYFSLYLLRNFYKFPRAACSLSIASNKALKFPLPKL